MSAIFAPCLAAFVVACANASVAALDVGPSVVQTDAPPGVAASSASEPLGPPPQDAAEQSPWLDRTRQSVYETFWHSAMRIDRWFGSTEDEAEYRKVFGSISPAVLWDRHYGYKTPVQFNLYLPLSRFDERFHAFVGRFDPNEYVTESEEPSGAFLAWIANCNAVRAATPNSAPTNQR